jgi:hypothetical protein
LPLLSAAAKRYERVGADCLTAVTRPRRGPNVTGMDSDPNLSEDTSEFVVGIVTDP